MIMKKMLFSAAIILGCNSFSAGAFEYLPLPPPPPPQSAYDGRDNAWRNGNYQSALDYQLRIANMDNSIEISAASDCFVLAMCYWNVGNRSQAIACVERGISCLRNGRYTAGSGCERAAVEFLQKMRNGDLPDKFNYYDTHTFGVLGYIMAVPEAVWYHKMGQHNARLDAIIRYCDSMIQSYQRRQDEIEREAKRYARLEYLNGTGCEFSIDHPPAYGTELRNKWDACRRVYDIFR